MVVPARRRSSFFRNRASVFVVEDTRGVPLQSVSYVLCLVGAVSGIRDGWFCDVSLTNDEKEIQMYADNFGGCANRPIEYSYWALNATWFLLVAAIRFAAARAQNTSDFFHAITFVAINDCLLAVIIFLMDVGSDEANTPLWWYVVAGSAALYQVYVSHVAFRAYRARLVLKDLEPSEMALASLRGPVYQTISALICVTLFVFTIRDFFFCDTGLYQAETLGLESLQDCHTRAVKRSWMQNVAVGRLSISVLRNFAAFGATNLESFLPAVTYQLCVADTGILLYLVRAEANIVTVVAWVVLVMGYDGYVWYAGNAAMNRLEEQEEEKWD